MCGPHTWSSATIRRERRGEFGSIVSVAPYQAERRGTDSQWALTRRSPASDALDPEHFEFPRRGAPTDRGAPTTGGHVALTAAGMVPRAPRFVRRSRDRFLPLERWLAAGRRELPLFIPHLEIRKELGTSKVQATGVFRSV